MPRLKRTLLDKDNFLHIMVQGINKENIFKKDNQKKEYIKLIKEYTEQYKIRLIAYCVMDNHVHMLVNYKEIKDITKFMQKINTIYAIYYNKNQDRVGYVYRGRYKSQLITDGKYFINCIIYIHNNPVKARICNNASDYRYSSYNDFIKKESLLKEIFVNIDMFIKMHTTINEESYYLEIIEDTEKQYNEYINDFLKLHKITISEINNNNEFIKEISYNLKYRYNLSYNKIEKLIKVHREKVRRILLKK